MADDARELVGREGLHAVHEDDPVAHVRGPKPGVQIRRGLALRDEDPLRESLCEQPHAARLPASHGAVKEDGYGAGRRRRDGKDARPRFALSMRDRPKGS